MTAGFVIAGGVSKLSATLADSGVEVGPTASATDTFAVDGLATPLQWLTDHGYTRFTGWTLHGDAFYADALAPGRDDVVDSISMVGGGAPEAEPMGELDEAALVFTVADVAIEVIPEVVAVAPSVVGGLTVSHLIVDNWDGELALRPYVSGDEYGSGSGYGVWSADGSRLIRVVR
ncbi:hypothetical protein ACQBAU_12405 [Propionibacteriaceae bacterium Y2011]